MYYPTWWVGGWNPIWDMGWTLGNGGLSDRPGGRLSDGPGGGLSDGPGGGLSDSPGRRLSDSPGGGLTYTSHGPAASINSPSNSPAVPSSNIPLTAAAATTLEWQMTGGPPQGWMPGQTMDFSKQLTTDQIINNDSEPINVHLQYRNMPSPEGQASPVPFITDSQTMPQDVESTQSCCSECVFNNMEWADDYERDPIDDILINVAKELKLSREEHMALKMELFRNYIRSFEILRKVDYSTAVHPIISEAIKRWINNYDEPTTNERPEYIHNVEGFTGGTVYVHVVKEGHVEKTTTEQECHTNPLGPCSYSCSYACPARKKYNTLAAAATVLFTLAVETNERMRTSNLYSAIQKCLPTGRLVQVMFKGKILPKGSNKLEYYDIQGVGETLTAVVKVPEYMNTRSRSNPQEVQSDESADEVPTMAAIEKLFEKQT